MGLFKSKKKLEAELAAEVASGRYFRALQYYMENGRFAEAAGIQARKGEPEKAGRLYERAGDLGKAAEMFMLTGDFGMAALLFRDAGKHQEAALAFGKDGRHESAAELFESLGEPAAAAEHWRLAGDMSRAATNLAESGDTAEAAKIGANEAERNGNKAAAAALWVTAGDLPRALALFREADLPEQAAAIAETLGDVPLAAQLRMQHGDFATAGQHFEACGMTREAALAYGRAGDVARAVALLAQVEQWMIIARVYLSHERVDEARAVLRRLRPEHPDFEVGLRTLAQLEESAESVEDAYRVYEALIRYNVDTNSTGAQTRGYVMSQVNILWGRGMFTEAVAKLGQLNTFGLMTPELNEKLEHARSQLEAPPTGTNQMRAMSAMLMAPQSERYEFKMQIAQGGNGVIYLAHDRTLDRELVIKMIRETALPTEIAIEWFLREAKTSAKLNHPNIVTIYDLGSIDGQPYIAMEFVDGETLVDFVERTELPMPPAKLVNIYLPLCRALQYAHDKGYVHRDIKLENVMITHGGEVKLMDFGLAQAMRSNEEEGMVTGTPLYMPPEQILGADVDHRADVYAMGIMLFLLGAGQWPYDRGNVLNHHRFSPVPDPREHNPDLPAAFAVVIQKCLAKAREDRYDTVSELGEALRACFPA